MSFQPSFVSARLRSHNVTTCLNLGNKCRQLQKALPWTNNEILQSGNSNRQVARKGRNVQLARLPETTERRQNREYIARMQQPPNESICRSLVIQRTPRALSAHPRGLSPRPARPPCQWAINRLTARCVGQRPARPLNVGRVFVRSAWAVVIRSSTRGRLSTAITTAL